MSRYTTVNLMLNASSNARAVSMALHALIDILGKNDENFNGKSQKLNIVVTKDMDPC